jgi:hypothetical protein
MREFRKHVYRHFLTDKVFFADEVVEVGPGEWTTGKW